MVEQIKKAYKWFRAYLHGKSDIVQPEVEVETYDTDQYYMMRAIEQARLSSRVKRLLPPYVGAVVANDDKIVGEGYKRFFSDKRYMLVHAERAALWDAGKMSEGATLYTTLQPCVRRYTTVFSPCSQFAIEAGIKKVVIGLHPTKGLNTKGIRSMQENGIEVVLFDGGLQEELDQLRDLSNTLYTPS